MHFCNSIQKYCHRIFSIFTHHLSYIYVFRNNLKLFCLKNFFCFFDILVFKGLMILISASVWFMRNFQLTLILQNHFENDFKWFRTNSVHLGEASQLGKSAKTFFYSTPGSGDPRGFGDSGIPENVCVSPNPRGWKNGPGFATTIANINSDKLFWDRKSVV